MTRLAAPVHIKDHVVSMYTTLEIVKGTILARKIILADLSLYKIIQDVISKYYTERNKTCD